MRCSSYKALISRYLDDSVSIREQNALFEHLNQCRACAAALARYRAIEASLRKLPESRPSAQVGQRIFERLVGGGAHTSERDARHYSLGKLRSRFSHVQHVAAQCSRTPSWRLALAFFMVASIGGLLAIPESQFGAVEPGIAPKLATATSANQAYGSAESNVPPVVRVASRTPNVASTLQNALLQAGAERPSRLPLPAYIPAGMRLERFSVNAGAYGNETEAFAVVYRAQDGKLVLIRHLVNRAHSVVSEAANVVTVKGREWWVDRHPTLSPGSLQAYLVFTRQDDEEVVVDAVLPLDELIRMVESIEWTEED